MDKKKLMLVADDQDINHVILKKIFNDEFEILSAYNGKSALELLYENLSEVSVFLLDLYMPVMDGFEVLRVIAEDIQLQNIPVVIITADTERDTEIKALELGASDCIAKPFDSTIVRQRVLNLVNKRENNTAIMESELLKQQSQTREQLDETEKNLEETSRRLSLLLDNIPGGIAVLNRSDIVSADYVNDSLAQMLGYSLAEFEGNFGNDFIGAVFPADAEYFHREINLANKANPRVSVSIRFRMRNEGITWFKINATLVEIDGVYKLYCIFIDINAEKEQEVLSRRANAQLQYRADHDELTDLYNYETYKQKTRNLLNSNPAGKYYIISWNIEQFRQINEIFGKSACDAILKCLANTLMSILLESGTCGRYESDNFFICIPRNLLSIEQMYLHVKNKLKRLQIGYEIVVAMGIYEVTDFSVSVAEMCNSAYMAMKSINGDRHKHFAFFNKAMNNSFRLETEIITNAGKAMCSGDFAVEFIPAVTTADEKLALVQALPVWNNEKYGSIKYDTFMPLFERNGFAAAIDLFSWERIFAFIGEHSDEITVPVTIPVSNVSLYSPHLCDDLVGLAGKYNVRFDKLVLSLNDSTVVADCIEGVANLNRLYAMGFSILFRHFANGSSSSKTLSMVPSDYIRFDFTDIDISRVTEKTLRVLTASVDMLTGLGMKVIAFGVDDVKKNEIVKKVNCTMFEGLSSLKGTAFENNI